MSLIRSKLNNVVERPDGAIVAQCPACATAGRDFSGNHLIVFPNGRFGCVVFSGDTPEGREHRKEIARLAGDGKRRPASSTGSNAQPEWGAAKPASGVMFLPVRSWQERFPPPRR